MIAAAVRPETPDDHAEIRRLLEAAFGRAEEADMLDKLRRDHDLVLSLVAWDGEAALAHVGFSRLWVDQDGRRFPAVALAPLAVLPAQQRQGIGGYLVREGHARLRAAGEKLVIVLGDPDYYRRFGYRHDLAAEFGTPFQSEALMALAFGEAPQRGTLIYPAAFGLA